MNPLRCLIVDDEPLARELLEDYVNRHEELTLATATGQPIAALQYLRDHRVDLIFLDINMPDLDGLRFTKIVGGTKPIILTTAYEQYALDGFELGVTDYLLKPISYERFARAVTRRTQIHAAPAPAVAPRLSAGQSSTTAPYVFIKSGHHLHRVDLADIFYLSGSGDYVTVYRRDGSKLLTLENLNDLAERLGVGFYRIHRSHAVALAHIDRVERGRVVIGATYLPISRSYLAGFMARLEA